MPDSLLPEDEIARLRAEKEALRAVLQPFATYNDAATFPLSTWSREPDCAPASGICGVRAPLTVGHFRAASAALASDPSTPIPHTPHTHPNPKREGEDHA